MSTLKNRARWSGVFPATLLPFKDDGTYAIDEMGLRQYVRRFVGVPGISGLVPNGHTGEIQALFPEERKRVVEIMVDEIGDSLPVISGVSAEASLEAIHHAQNAQKAGA
ncbi:MAG: dihydrodipicolinate synthase family protein, partial [Chloroflexota bacterium]